MRRIADLAAFPAEALAIYDDTRAHSDAATVRALFATLPSLHPLPWADVTVPTLLVRGARSGAFARFIAGAVARSLRHVSLDVAVIPGAAHWLANENDDAVAAALAPFVGAVTRSGAAHG
jgi:pimeloyl-ACP methyl ester carboxylesterase